MLVCSDAACLVLALLCAIALRYDTLSNGIADHTLTILVASPLITVVMFWLMGVYRNILRFADSNMTIRIGAVCFLSTLMIMGFSFLFDRAGTQSRGVFLIYGLIGFIFTSGTRIVIRQALAGGPAETRSPAIIYGAGVAGARLAEALRYDEAWKPLAFVDDNPRTQGMVVCNLPVLAPNKIDEFSKRHEIDAVFLAIPSVGKDAKRRILERVRHLGLKALTVPTLRELVGGLADFKDLRQLNIEDLIDRTLVSADESLINESLASGCVMVTGAGGSIGSELCRQILSIKPTKLVAIDQCEYNLYTLEQQLARIQESQQLPEPIPVRYILGDVCDRAFIDQTITSNDVRTVFHAAAYKHVPIVEANVLAGARTNVIGTFETAASCAANGVERFVLISTDKAALPTSMMGASKRLAECSLKVAYENNPDTTCRFSTVRFGNVMASSGSVIPLFRSQVESGGPVTVTHKDATRYFMTIPEAAELVLQSAAMSEGNDLFVLDMGKPFNIYELAKRIIELSGASLYSERNPTGIRIEFTGLRPGENLHEQLFTEGDALPTKHPLIMKAQEQPPEFRMVRNILGELQSALDARDDEKVRGLLKMSLAQVETDPGAAELITNSTQVNC